MELQPEVFLDFPDMSQRPTRVYAARIKGIDNQGNPYTRTRLFVKRATLDTAVERFREHAGPGYEVEVTEGVIQWEKLGPKKKKGKKPEPQFVDAALVPWEAEDPDQSLSRDGLQDPETPAG